MLKKAFLVNMSGIMVSRILGFVRDAMQAAVLGTSIYSDMFVIAFKFPNIFRRIFAEGAFVQTFLPFFLKSNKKSAFSISIFSIFLFLILLFSLFVMLFAPFFTKIIALGYDENMINLAMPLVKINFWYLILIFITTYFGSLLQYKNIFWVSAYNTALLNLFLILALFCYRNQELIEIVYILSYAVLLGGLAQIAIHFYPLYKSGMMRLQFIGMKQIRKYIKKKQFSELLNDIKDFFKNFFAAMLGASSAQIAAILDSSLVTLLSNSDGGVSILNYANRIFQLPLALFAIAISTVIFPTIAKYIRNEDDIKALKMMKNAFWFLLIMLSMSVLGGIMLSKEIVWLLFERYSFTRDDTVITSLTFIGYMIGLLPFGLAKILSLWLYSKKKQGIAAKISAISLLFGLLFSLILMWDLRYFGLALASSIGGFILFILNVKELGFKNFLYIIDSRKFFLLLIFALIFEFIAIYCFKLFFSI